MRRLFPRAAFSLICLVTGLPLHAAHKWTPVTPAELAETKPQIEPEAAAELLTYRLEIDDSEGRYRSIDRSSRFKIFDPARSMDVTRIVSLWNGVNPNYEFAARLTLPDGTTRDFGLKDLQERKVAEEGHSTGLLGLMTARSNWGVDEKFLAITGVVKGSVIDVWEREPDLKRTDWLMNSIQRVEVPIRHFEYFSRHDQNSKIKYRFYALHPSNGQMKENEKKGELEFTASNLPSLVHENFSPPQTYFSLTLIETYEYLENPVSHRSNKIKVPDPVLLSLGPWAYYSTREDYNDADRGFATKRVKEQAVALVAGITDDREKARRIYEYVRSLYQRFNKRADLENRYTRYIESLDELVDLGRIDSTLIDETDFYFLFVSLARSAGLESHSVFHPLRTSFPFQIDLVSPNFISTRSVAVKVGDTWVVCNPCAEVPLAFGALAWQVENQPALLALSHQQVFLNIPSPAAENSTTKVEADLALAADGSLSGEGVWTFTGHCAHELRERLSLTGEEEWSHLARSILELEGSDVEVHLLKVDGLDLPQEPVVLRARVRWPTYGDLLKDRMVIVPAVFRQGQPPRLNESKRTTPVFFKYPRTELDSVKIHLPKGYQPGAMPKPITGGSGNFSYVLTLTHETGSELLGIEREAINRAIEVPVTDYPRARDWFRRVTAADQIRIVLTPTAAAATH